MIVCLSIFGQSISARPLRCKGHDEGHAKTARTFELRWTFLVAGFLGLGSFAAMTWRFGLDIEYRFEVAIISITWSALVVLGVMLAFFFRSQPRQHAG